MSSWNNRKVFVTGATGLLGSRLVEDLLAEGANVTCLVRDWVAESKLLTSKSLTRCNLVHGDLVDFSLLLRAINEYEIDSVFHLGAQTIVDTARRSPISTFESNIRGTWNLLDACRQCRPYIERIIVASSDKAYGCHDRLPYGETTPLSGRFPYDVSKSCTDLISLSYYHTYGLPVCVTRCGNLFGAGDLNFNRLVPGTILSALKNERPVIRSDGKFVRDYFYVADAAAAYLHLAERLPNDEFAGEAFNFSAEFPQTAIELVNRILNLMGKSNLTPEILGQANYEIRKQYLDCTKARDALGWSPNYSLDDGLTETIDWYRGWFRSVNLGTTVGCEKSRE